METTQDKIYKVPESNLTVLEARIAKLAKRAAKLGVGTVSMNVLGHHDIPMTNEFGDFIKYRRVHDVTITGDAPKINGWQFVAVLQPVLAEDGKRLGNMLRIVPGTSVAIPEVYRAASSNCDHCKTQRFRNETFVLMSEMGCFKQVGRQCLRDFLGHVSPDTYAEWAELLLDASDLAESSEGDYNGAQGVRRFASDDILSLAASAIRILGWRSNKTAQEFGGQSTAGAISEWINSNADQRAKWEKRLEVIEADKTVATEVYTWLQSLSTRENLNDYMYNLSLLGQGATFTYKNFGLVCAAIPTYLKEQEREVNRRKRFAEDANSQYVGIVGERHVFNLTLVYTNNFVTDYGVTHFYKFKTEDGNLVTWFASSMLYVGQDEIQVGNTIRMKARVKKHEEYKGVKQTVITRAKLDVPKPDKKLEKLLATIAWG